mgnify:CR=1 FL=1
MNYDSNKTIELEQEYRRLLRYLRKQKEVEENKKINHNQVDCNQPK